MPILALGLLFGCWLQMQQPRLWPEDFYGALAGAAILALSGLLAARLRNNGQPAQPAHIDPLGAVSGSRQGNVWRWFQTALMFASAAALGYGTTGWRATGVLADRLAQPLWGQVVLVEGVVQSLPVRRANGTRFVFRPLHAAAGMPSRVMVSWHAPRQRPGPADAPVQTSPGNDQGAAQAPQVHPGEVWRLPLRLKPVHGAANPAGFDAELWLFEQGIGATATVSQARRFEPPKALGHLQDGADLALQSLRDRLRARIDAALAGNPQAGTIAALALGDQAAIASREWTIYRITGVAHLMSISGLHITMLAWLAAWLAGFVWRRTAHLRHPGPLWLPTPTVAGVFGLLAATAYCLLAGFGVPAQRTLLMLAVGLSLRMSGLRISWRQTLSWALLAVLLWDPWALMQAGFWLSFCAVGILFLADPAKPRLEAADPSESAMPAPAMAAPAPSRLRTLAHGAWSRLRAAGRSQWAVTLALAPLTLLFFQQIAILSPLANAAAIPVVTLWVAPLAVLGLLLPAPLDAWVWQAAAWVQAGLARVLAELASWPQAQWHAAAPEWPALVLAALGVLALVLPWPWRLRAPGLALIIPLLLNPGQRPAEGHVEAWIADVGQGMGIIVRTARHTLLFDTGPTLGLQSDAGERVLLPLLHTLGERRLDRVVLSHADSDHIGGAASIARAYPGTAAVSSVAAERVLAMGYASAQPCVAGMRWTWDGVDFQLLHPAAADPAPAQRTNAHSCVLRVASRHGSLLLTGDIERAQERALAAGPAADALGVDLLLAAHHGSKTSSSAEFLQAVAPRLVAVQAGFMNSYGHPHADVLQRYADLGLPVQRTDRAGALVWRDEHPAELESWRAKWPRYWQLPWPQASAPQRLSDTAQPAQAMAAGLGAGGQATD
ncbi:MAG: DNA internalization-related competence protein ComEC/Rec2 [Thiomonas sp.]